MTSAAGRSSRPSRTATSASRQTSHPSLEKILSDGSSLSARLLLDANVLIPQYLRAIVLDLAFDALFEVHWTSQILEEVRRNLVKPRDAGGRYAMTPQLTARLLDQMTQSFPNARVQGHEIYEPSFAELVDDKDRHVAAGALALHLLARRPVLLLTANLRDLPQRAFLPWSILVVSPDEFLATLLRVRSDEVSDLVRSTLTRFSRPPIDDLELLEVLVGAGCTEFANALAQAWGHAPAQAAGAPADGAHRSARSKRSR